MAQFAGVTVAMVAFFAAVIYMDARARRPARKQS